MLEFVSLKEIIKYFVILFSYWAEKWIQVIQLTILSLYISHYFTFKKNALKYILLRNLIQPKKT